MTTENTATGWRDVGGQLTPVGLLASDEAHGFTAAGLLVRRA